MLKVNVKIAAPNINGFMNIDPLANPQDQNCIAADITNIDPFVDHNSTELLIAMDVLDYFPLQLRLQILNNYCCKIAHGGKIIIGGLDIREVARAIYYQSIDLFREGNFLLYGAADHIMRLKKSLVTLEDTEKMIIQTNQFQITSKRFDGPNYIIEAQRN